MLEENNLWNGSDSSGVGVEAIAFHGRKKDLSEFMTISNSISLVIFTSFKKHV